jgi:DNA repair exonuclease SbcCD ATPase subunit
VSKDASTLSGAAEGLETELRRYEELALGLERGRLASEKDLRRAARELEDLRTSDVRLAELLQALVAAIGAARDRQQAQAEAVQRRAEDIRRRSEALGRLLARWERLGAEAADVNRLAQGSAGDANGGDGRAKLASVVEELRERLGRLAEEARSLAVAAESESFIDLARRTESLRDQLLSARNKLRPGEDPE